MTREEIEDSIYEILKPLLPDGVNAVWAKQSAPRPAKPYVTLDFLIFGQKIGQDELRQVPSGWERQGLRQFTLSVNGYGQDSFSALDELLTGISLEKTVQALAEAGMAAVSQSEIRDLSELIEQRFETRAQMDMIFYRNVAKAEDLDFFDKVEINDELVE